MSKSPSPQRLKGARDFRENQHTNPYVGAPIRWRREWQAGYDAEKAKRGAQ